MLGSVISKKETTKASENLKLLSIALEEKARRWPPFTSSVVAVEFHGESKGGGELDFLGVHCNS